MPSIIRFSSSTVVFSFASKKMVILRRRIIRKISHILPSVETTACDRQTCGLVGPGPPKTGGLFRALLRRLRAQSGQPRVRHRDQKGVSFYRPSEENGSEVFLVSVKNFLSHRTQTIMKSCFFHVVSWRVCAKSQKSFYLTKWSDLAGKTPSSERASFAAAADPELFQLG